VFLTSRLSVLDDLTSSWLTVEKEFSDRLQGQDGIRSEKGTDSRFCDMSVQVLGRLQGMITEE
jgi:hypothetical protein